jgi:hypothetical protein
MTTALGSEPRSLLSQELNLLELNLPFDLERETDSAERHCRLGREPLVVP